MKSEQNDYSSDFINTNNKGDFITKVDGQKSHTIMKEKKVMGPKIYIIPTLVKKDMNLKRVLEKRISHL